MWRNEMWGGLLRWCESDPEFGRELAIRRTARGAIRELLREERLAQLSVSEFSRSVASPGGLLHPDGRQLVPDELAQLSPERLQGLLDDGRLIVIGNPLLAGEQASGARRSALQCGLPGLDTAGSERLRRWLSALLRDPTAPPAEAIARAAGRGSPLSHELAAVILSLCSPHAPAIRDHTRLLGLRRLAFLLDAGPRSILTLGDSGDDRECFDAACSGLRDASRGVLRDPLALDLLLVRVAALREPAAWKVAIGLNEVSAEG
ncbi:MAG TPA: hypothetical protein DEP45_15215 [Armatimonadetes bacterium]|nr:hypothetical protein [Armatimonadota bacterium]